MRPELIKYRGENSQEYMGNLYGVTQQAWSKWETGKSTPKLSIMKQIEIDSGISMEKIFFDAFNNLKLVNIKSKRS